MTRAIAIVGPTASGKSGVAAALARLLNGQIVSADSRQIYRRLDIGTNKEGRFDPASGLRFIDDIAQHLTDIIEPDERYSAGAFAQQAGLIMGSLRASRITPIITGGTGLYVRALTEGLVPLPPASEVLRETLRSRIAAEGLDGLERELAAVDAVSASAHRGNPQRVMRALEVYHITGTPLSILQKRAAPSGDASIRLFGLMWDRSELYRHIDRRTNCMFDSGLIEETRSVLASGISRDAPGLQGIGYRRSMDVLDGILSEAQARLMTAQETRHYAKRQMTWFSKATTVEWIPVCSSDFTHEHAAERIAHLLTNEY